MAGFGQIIFWRRRERMIGKASRSRRFDIALENAQGTGFLALLVGLMCFLVMIAVSASFALSAMSERWSSGLENKITIEIPAETANGDPRDKKTLTALSEQVQAMLAEIPNIKSIEPLSDADVSELVKPWLGEDLPLSDIPLPALISIETHNSDDANLDSLAVKLKNISGNIRLDTHEDWLLHLLRFTKTLQLTTFLISLIVGITTIIAIAGAVKARLAVLGEQIELLHLIGATDRYIAKQFQTYSFFVSLKGSIIGALVCGVFLLFIGMLFGDMAANLLPDFHLSFRQVMLLCCVPIIISFFAMMTARHTVMSALGKLP